MIVPRLPGLPTSCRATKTPSSGTVRAARVPTRPRTIAARPGGALAVGQAQEQFAAQPGHADAAGLLVVDHRLGGGAGEQVGGDDQGLDPRPGLDGPPHRLDAVDEERALAAAVPAVGEQPDPLDDGVRGAGYQRRHRRYERSLNTGDLRMRACNPSAAQHPRKSGRCTSIQKQLGAQSAQAVHRRGPVGAQLAARTRDPDRHVLLVSRGGLRRRGAQAGRGDRGESPVRRTRSREDAGADLRARQTGRPAVAGPRCPHWDPDDIELAPYALIMVADGMEIPGNLGTLIRTARRLPGRLPDPHQPAHPADPPEAVPGQPGHGAHDPIVEFETAGRRDRAG